MKKPLMIGAAMLLALGAFGAGAASEGHLLRRHGESAEASPSESRLTRRADRERHGRAERHDSGRRRHDDHERRGSRGAAALSDTGPSDPNAPTPDNGLFNRGARPKVEVQ